MSAYYNEHDAGAAAWLRELIAGGHIAPGEVDTRSIVDVRPDDLAGYSQCHFFAGIGGWSYALRLAGWPDDRSVWTGSCPCQPFSLAGKQKGFADDRHLWPVFRELIRERSPAVVFGEQVASASEWLGLVRGELEAMGYAVGTMPVQAASAGADHLRDRFWFVADNLCVRDDRTASEIFDKICADGFMGDAPGVGWSQGRSEHEIWRRRRATSDDGSMVHAAGIGSGPGLREGNSVGHGNGPTSASRTVDLVDAIGERGCRRHCQRQDATHADAASEGKRDWYVGRDGKCRSVKSGLRLLADGFPSRVGLLRGFGNAIDPRPAAAFIKAADEAMCAVRTSTICIRDRGDHTNG